MITNSVMYEHRREIALIYQDSHLLEERSLQVIQVRVEEFIGMFERIVTDAAKELSRPLPLPHLLANILTLLPVMIAFRRWSLGKETPPAQAVEQITGFPVRGLGFESA